MFLSSETDNQRAKIFTFSWVNSHSKATIKTLDNVYGLCFSVLFVHVDLIILNATLILELGNSWIQLSMHKSFTYKFVINEFACDIATPQ